MDRRVVDSRVMCLVRGGFCLEGTLMIAGDRLWDAQTALSELLEKPGWKRAERKLIEVLSDALNDDSRDKVQAARTAIMAAKGAWDYWKQALLWPVMEKVQEAFPLMKTTETVGSAIEQLCSIQSNLRRIANELGSVAQMKSDAQLALDEAAPLEQFLVECQKSNPEWKQQQETE